MGVRSGWGQGGCVKRIEVIVKVQKNGGVRSGVRVDVYKELIEVIVKMKKKSGVQGSDQGLEVGRGGGG